MTSAAFGLAVFAVLSAVSLTTLYLYPRLPPDHLSKETHDVVKVGVGMIVVLSALVLGLLIASVKTTFDTATRDLKRFSTEIVLLDRTLRAYGPEAAPARQLLERYVEQALAGTWPGSGQPEVVEDPQAERLMWQAQDKILALTPEQARQRVLSDEMKRDIRELIEQRWTLIEEATGSLNVPLLIVLVVWLVIVFASFGYNAPRNRIVKVSLVLSAASIGGALFLVVQMDRPFEGLIKVSPAPLQEALVHIREPA